jgi:hypothetical protein
MFTETKYSVHILRHVNHMYFPNIHLKILHIYTYFSSVSSLHSKTYFPHHPCMPHPPQSKINKEITQCTHGGLTQNRAEDYQIQRMIPTFH